VRLRCGGAYAPRDAQQHERHQDFSQLRDHAEDWHGPERQSNDG
jgi:hypothetical protein